VEPLSQRTAYVEVVNAGTGRGVFGEALSDAHPPQTSVPWQPMEFIAAVDSAGLVGPVVPTVRSGVDEVDAYFGLYLAETLRILKQTFANGCRRLYGRRRKFLLTHQNRTCTFFALFRFLQRSLGLPR
jgi:hypothetical protein